MPVGRPPKPTAQHKLDGTYQKCRHENRADERLAVGAPIKPDFDCEEASRAWDQIVAVTPPEVLAEADTLFLTGLSRWFAQYMRWMTEFEQENDINQAYKISGMVAACWKPCDRGFTKLGMSATDRARLKIVKETPESTVKTRQRA